MLKNCPDCQQQYSIRAQQCPHCGAPNDDLVNQSVPVDTEEGDINWGWMIALIVFVFVMLFYGKESRDYVLNLFNVGIVGEVDLQDCTSTRVSNEIKDTFAQSPYALTNHLKVIMVESEEVTTRQGAVLSCLSELTLNNNQKVLYQFDFKKQGDQYLIEGSPR